MKHRIRLRTVVIDCADAHGLADFYSRLLGWPITATEPDWALLRDPNGGTGLSFQAEENYHPPVWPKDPVCQDAWASRGQGLRPAPAKMLRLDFLVEDLEASLHRALHCGARLAPEQLFPNMRVLLDPAGHPFCLFTDQDFDWDVE